jgi:hypothetical protein
MPESSWNRVIYWKLSSGFRVAFGWWLLSASVADTVLGLNSLLRCQLSPSLRNRRFLPRSKAGFRTV